MKLYKYKSLKNFEHVADIICNKRFHTVPFYKLNDPMEGLFNYNPKTKREYLDAIKEGKRRLRICSFSEDPQNILLWAHYADGFKGICIEVEIKDGDEPSNFFDVKKVQYDSTRLLFHNEACRMVSMLPEMILSKKAEEWAVEKEVRLLSTEPYIQKDIKIKGILLGVSIPDILKQTIIKLVTPDIQIRETYIGDTNKIEIRPPMNSKRPQD